MPRVGHDAGPTVVLRSRVRVGPRCRVPRSGHAAVSPGQATLPYPPVRPRCRIPRVGHAAVFHGRAAASRRPVGETGVLIYSSTFLLFNRSRVQTPERYGAGEPPEQAASEAGSPRRCDAETHLPSGRGAETLGAGPRDPRPRRRTVRGPRPRIRRRTVHGARDPRTRRPPSRRAEPRPRSRTPPGTGHRPPGYPASCSRKLAGTRSIGECSPTATLASAATNPSGRTR